MEIVEFKKHENTNWHYRIYSYLINASEFEVIPAVLIKAREIRERRPHIYGTKIDGDWIQWLEDNLENKWTLVGDWIYLEKLEDAIEFKMIWGDHET